MCNPVRAEEMAFAISIFVSAVGGKIFPSGPPDALRTVRERRECREFLAVLSSEEPENRSLEEAAGDVESPFFRALFTVWEHYRDDDGRPWVVTRVLSFYSLMERTRGAILERWYDANPEGPQTVLLHPAVIEALATVALGPGGRLSADEFIRAVESAATTYPELSAAKQVGASGAAVRDWGSAVTVRQRRKSEDGGRPDTGLQVPHGRSLGSAADPDL